MRGPYQSTESSASELTSNGMNASMVAVQHREKEALQKADRFSEDTAEDTDVMRDAEF